MTSTDERPRFYDSQYLEAADLTAVVEHARTHRARHALGAHTWGIALGLELRELPGPGGTLDVVLQPGYAWDGFGRPVVVREPGRVPPALFAEVDAGFVPGNPPQVVEVWLSYHEDLTRGPRPGFEDCADVVALARVVESYRVEVGRRGSVAARRDPVDVAGRTVDAAQALRAVDPLAPELVDASVPHQQLPADTEGARWLIPVGVVLWEPGNPGRFVARDAVALDRDARGRHYCGTVAGSIEAAGGRVRVHDRTRLYGPVTDELLAVEGDLRVDGDARIYGRRLQFLQSHAEDPVRPFHLLRREDVSGTALQVVIGEDSAGANRLAVGRRISVDATTGQETHAESLVVTDSGRVGVGTSQPRAPLEVPEDGLQIGSSSAPQDNFHVRSDTDGPRALRVYHGDHGAGAPVASFTATGRLGVGTTDPSQVLHVDGVLGLRQNDLYLSGGDRDWSSVSYNAHRGADGQSWAFPDPARPAVTVEMDSAGAGAPRWELWTTLPGANTTWRSRLKVFGHTGDIGMAAPEGRVGIGTYSPGAKLDVRGEIHFAGGLRPLGATTARRVVHGNVDSTGNPPSGDGFTVARLGTGRYEITFTPAFTAVPTVVVTAVWGALHLSAGTGVQPRQNAIVDRITASSALLATANPAGTLTDSTFCFLAIGER